MAGPGNSVDDVLDLLKEVALSAVRDRRLRLENACLPRDSGLIHLLKLLSSDWYSQTTARVVLERANHVRILNRQ